MFAVILGSSIRTDAQYMEKFSAAKEGVQLLVPSYSYYTYCVLHLCSTEFGRSNARTLAFTLIFHLEATKGGSRRTYQWMCTNLPSSCTPKRSSFGSREIFFSSSYDLKCFSLVEEIFFCHCALSNANSNEFLNIKQAFLTMASQIKARLKTQPGGAPRRVENTTRASIIARSRSIKTADAVPKSGELNELFRFVRVDKKKAC